MGEPETTNGGLIINGSRIHCPYAGSKGGPVAQDALLGDWGTKTLSGDLPDLI